jgi:hypothetical protein
MQKENPSKTCKKLHFFEVKNGKKAWFFRENEFANTTAKMVNKTTTETVMLRKLSLVGTKYMHNGSLSRETARLRPENEQMFI